MITIEEFLGHHYFMLIQQDWKKKGVYLYLDTRRGNYFMMKDGKYYRDPIELGIEI